MKNQIAFALILAMFLTACGTWLRARVRAQDALGDWGEWSNWLEVYIELPVPG